VWKWNCDGQNIIVLKQLMWIVRLAKLKFKELEIPSGAGTLLLQLLQQQSILVLNITYIVMIKENQCDGSPSKLLNKGMAIMALNTFEDRLAPLLILI